MMKLKIRTKHKNSVASKLKLAMKKVKVHS